MTFLRHVAFWAFAGLSIWLALANRVPVRFSLMPLPFEIELPLYLLLFAALIVGMGMGSFVAWQAGLRRARRAARKKPLPRPAVETITSREPSRGEAEAAEKQKVLP